MYYRLLTVECVWLSLCAFQWNQGFLWTVQDYEVLCDCTLYYLYWYLDLLYLYLYLDFMYWYWYLHLHLTSCTCTCTCTWTSCTGTGTCTCTSPLVLVLVLDDIVLATRLNNPNFNTGMLSQFSKVSSCDIFPSAILFLKVEHIGFVSILSLNVLWTSLL